MQTPQTATMQRPTVILRSGEAAPTVSTATSGVAPPTAPPSTSTESALTAPIPTSTEATSPTAASTEHTQASPAPINTLTTESVPMETPVLETTHTDAWTLSTCSNPWRPWSMHLPKRRARRTLTPAQVADKQIYLRWKAFRERQRLLIEQRGPQVIQFAARERKKVVKVEEVKVQGTVEKVEMSDEEMKVKLSEFRDRIQTLLKGWGGDAPRREEGSGV